MLIPTLVLILTLILTYALANLAVPSLLLFIKHAAGLTWGQRTWKDCVHTTHVLRDLVSRKPLRCAQAPPWL